MGAADGSLALHKLAYPCLAFRDRVPRDMPIIPVYLKASVGQDGVTYNVAAFEAFERGGFTLDMMRPVEVRRLKLAMGMA